MSRSAITYTVRAGNTAETWTTFPVGRKAVVITKSTVRVAKGQKGGGQFHGATNLRGTVTL